MRRVGAARRRKAAFADGKIFLRRIMKFAMISRRIFSSAAWHVCNMCYRIEVGHFIETLPEAWQPLMYGISSKQNIALCILGGAQKYT